MHRSEAKGNKIIIKTKYYTHPPKRFYFFYLHPISAGQHVCLSLLIQLETPVKKEICFTMCQQYGKNLVYAQNNLGRFRETSWLELIKQFSYVGGFGALSKVMKTQKWWFKMGNEQLLHVLNHNVLHPPSTHPDLSAHTLLRYTHSKSVVKI